MRRLLLLLLLLALPSAASAEAVSTFIANPTTQNLLSVCTSEDREFKWSDRAYCTGYVLGVFSGSDIHPESVLADGVSFNMLYDTMRESIAQHPTNQHGNRRLQRASHVLIESWVAAKLITFALPQGNVTRN